MTRSFRSIFAAALLLGLTAVSLQAIELPDSATSEASASLHYSKPTPGKKSAPALAIAGMPYSYYRSDPSLARQLERGIKERLIECGLLASSKGSPVKGLRLQIGLDFVNSLNQFENIVTATVKTNGDGEAFVTVRQVPGDPLFEQVSGASFFSAGAFPTNNKRLSKLHLSCAVKEGLRGP